MSLQLLAQAGLSARSRLIDVGAGASTLVHDLLDKGLRDISVLDVSQEALPLVTGSVSANRVTWYAGDVLELALPPGYFDFWHDPAVLHFLTDPDDARTYAHIAAGALTTGGHAVFAPGTPGGDAPLTVPVACHGSFKKRWIGAPALPSAVAPKSVVFGATSATCGGGAPPCAWQTFVMLHDGAGSTVGRRETFEHPPRSAHVPVRDTYFLCAPAQTAPRAAGLIIVAGLIILCTGGDGRALALRTAER